MRSAYLFPGQGVQHRGMGSELYKSNRKAKELFELGNEVLGFRITDLMFHGSEEELKQTLIAQPAVFITSVIITECCDDFAPHMVAGHSLGEISAIVAARAISFVDGLTLVSARAKAMHEICLRTPSSMIAILGLSADAVEQICISIKETTVSPANYNCPGQVVISGTLEGLEIAVDRLRALGAKRTIPLQVSGAFHSPLMQGAAEVVERVLGKIRIMPPICPIYHNVDGNPAMIPEVIRENLIAQVTQPVQWQHSIVHMLRNGATEFVECGHGSVLQSFVKRIDDRAAVRSLL